MTIYDHEPDCDCYICSPPQKKYRYWHLCGWLQKYGCDGTVYCYLSDHSYRDNNSCLHKHGKFKVNHACMWRDAP
jgi:hypothetical protein